MLLIEKGADPKVKNYRNETPVMFAIFNGNEEMLSLLKKTGVEVTREDYLRVIQLTFGQFSESTYITRVQEGREEEVELFLMAGMDVEASDSLHKTALSYAAEEGRADMVKFLIEKDASVDGAKGEGSFESPLMMALMIGHVGTVKVLIEEGANINAVDAYGNTILQQIARKP